jgi:hypothetical protein
MKKRLLTILFLFTLVVSAGMLHAQGMKMGEVIIVSNPTLTKDVKPDAFKDWVNQEIVPSWDKKHPGTSMHLFQADRGKRKGEFLFVTGTATQADRNKLSQGNPFTENVITPAEFFNDPGSYTEYRLIGAKNFNSLPVAGILGIHYIKIKPGHETEFEKFVTEKLHPAVGQLFPDMQLLYYKAVAGDNRSEYITIFTIESVAARDKYWPAGAPETEALKKGFVPLKKLALELGDYLVEGSYLKPESGGAAAYFESTIWTDFVYSFGSAK